MTVFDRNKMNEMSIDWFIEFHYIRTVVTRVNSD